MANRQYGEGWYTKVMLAGDTDPVMDISDCTLGANDADKVLIGKTFYKNTGEGPVAGTCDYDVNSSAVPSGKELASAEKILTGYAAYAGGQSVIGTMASQSGLTIDASEAETPTLSYALAQGFYPTGSNVTLTNVTAAKIANGETLFGITGTGGGEQRQTKTVTGNLAGQTVNPDEGYLLSSVIISAVPQTTTQGTHGYTLTIG